MTRDEKLMYRVVVGMCHPEDSAASQLRCDAAAQMYRWDGDKLWVRGRLGGEREVVPTCDRRQLV